MLLRRQSPPPDQNIERKSGRGVDAELVLSVFRHCPDISHSGGEVLPRGAFSREFRRSSDIHGGKGPLEPLANFTTNPAGAQIVNAVGPIRQVVQADAPAPRRILVVAPVVEGKIGTPVQVQH